MALTKVTGQVINATTDLVVGVTTVGGGLSAADGFFSGITTITSATDSTSTSTGALIVTGGVGVGGSLNVGGSVSVGGTLTYEDVTNVDSVGLITARKGISVTGGDIKVGSAITLSQDNIWTSGIVTATTLNVTTGDLKVGSAVTISQDNVFTTGIITATSYNNSATAAINSQSGNFLVGKDSVYGSGKAQIHHTSQYVLDLNAWSADANAAVLAFYKSRNATPGSNHVLQADDGIASLRFLGNDGSNSREAAYIKAFVDGTPGTDDMPGRIVFGTTLDGSQSSTERLRITNSGQIQCNQDGSTTANNISVGAAADLKIYHTGDDSYISNGTNTGLIIRNLGNSNIVIQTQNSYPIQFKTNGTERAQFDSTGILKLYGDGGNNVKIYGHDGANLSYILGQNNTDDVELTNFRAGNLLLKTNNATRLTISSTGQATFTGGTVSRALKVNCTHTSGGEIVCFDNGVNNHYGALVVSAGEIDRECRLEAAYGNSLMTFWTQDSAAYERMRINKDGNVTVGTANDDGGGAANTDDGCVLRKDGLIAARVSTGTNSVAFTAKTIDTGGATALRCLSAQTQVGSVTFNSGGTSFNTSSDYRRKENLVSITDGITKVKQLKTYRFNFKDNPSVTIDGFLAHEAQEVIPFAVTGTKDEVSADDTPSIKKGDPIYQQLDQSKLVPLLTAALQEAIAEIEILKTKVSALESA